MSLRDNAWHVLNDSSDPRFRLFHGIIYGLIVYSVAIVFVDLLIYVGRPMPDFVERSEDIILLTFALEYAARLWVIRGAVPRSIRLSRLGKLRYVITARLRFVFSVWGLIDAIALLSFARPLRALRLLRLLRSIEFFRYATPLRTLFLAFRENRILFAVASGFVVMCVVLSAVMLFLAEFGVNPQIDSIGDTLWWSVVTISTVGFGDITPTTGEGKIIGSALMFAGMFVIALFAGVVSSTLVGHLLPLRLEQVRMSSIADHIIIAGWNERVPMLLRELALEYSEGAPQVIIFAPGQRPEALDPEVLYVTGDFTKESEYDKVRLRFARSIVVTAGPGSNQGSQDATTVLTIFTIRSLESRMEQERAIPLHVVAEILDPENYHHALVAGADEVIETARLGSSLLAHVAGNPGVGNALASLLMASRNNVYASQLPASFHKGQRMNFREMQRRAQDELGVLVLGIVHHDQLELNPNPDTEVYAGDQVVYIGSGRLV